MYREQMKTFIEEERFEEAAELRDMIKALEQTEPNVGEAE